LWREERLVAEFDSWRHHGGRASFERDRRRDARLQAAGYRVLRVTWRHLDREPERLIATLAQLLGSGVPGG
jgi:very-short-patch-repair endonuclease